MSSLLTRRTITTQPEVTDFGDGQWCCARGRRSDDYRAKTAFKVKASVVRMAQVRVCVRVQGVQNKASSKCVFVLDAKFVNSSGPVLAD